MNDYSKITALYSRLSVGDEDRDGGESNSIQNQKKFLESYARQLKLTNIRGVLRRYAAMLLVGTSFIFSSISFLSSSVT